MPKYRVIAIEETESYAEEFRKKLKGGKIFARYLFDFNSHTYCCELTPSYELRFLGSEFFPVDDLMSEEEREEIYEKILEADCHSEDVVYMHCSRVDSMKFYETEADDIEEAFESARGNVSFPEGVF